MIRSRTLPAAVAFLAAALLAGPGAAAVHVVDQTGFVFDSADITINVGDTVQWVWSSGSHTVTSGSGPTDPAVGALFDADLDSGSPVFSFIFTSAGVRSYFCRPHFGLGMTGVVRVEQSVPAESDTWGAVKTLYR